VGVVADIALGESAIRKPAAGCVLPPYN